MRQITCVGRAWTVRELSAYANLSVPAMLKRLDRGLTGLELIAPRQAPYQTKQTNKIETHEINGENLTVSQIAAMAKTTPQTIRYRAKTGCVGERLLTGKPKMVDRFREFEIRWQEVADRQGGELTIQQHTAKTAGVTPGGSFVCDPIQNYFNWLNRQRKKTQPS